ncbi:uncharacterized protein LOC143290416 [Babylonia areolata]|uniref:uncharacterized protein LOC143290416 n=1 Tax=Babylonia areolata TaxID=304850 RepID=UPI003FD30538
MSFVDQDPDTAEDDHAVFLVWTTIHQCHPTYPTEGPVTKKVQSLLEAKGLTARRFVVPATKFLQRVSSSSPSPTLPTTKQHGRRRSYCQRRRSITSPKQQGCCRGRGWRGYPLIPKPNYAPTPGYATRKTIAQGALLAALMMANASQVTALLDAQDDCKACFFVCLLVLLALSLLMQLVTAVLLIVVGITRPDMAQTHQRVIRLNTVTVCIAFLITILNVFITAFSITYVHENSHTTPTLNP